MMSEGEIQRRLDLLLRTGCLLMESGADTSRVMRTMKRVAAYMGLPLERLNIYIVYNMLMVNLPDCRQSFTRFQRVERHGIDLDTLRQVSHLSCEAQRTGYSLDYYERQLSQIACQRRNYSPGRWLWGRFGLRRLLHTVWLRLDGFLLCSPCRHPRFASAYVAGGSGQQCPCQHWCGGFRLYADSLGLQRAVAVGYGLGRGDGHLCIQHAVASVAGLCAVHRAGGVAYQFCQRHTLRLHTDRRDAGNGNADDAPRHGFRHCLAIRVCGIDNFAKNLPMTPHHAYDEYSLAAAVSAIGFSMIFNTPRHLMGFVALGGVVSVCMRNFVNLGPSSGNIGLDLGLVVGSFVGSAVVSILCCALVRWLHTPHQLLSIPSVIPMIPGVLMYRALFAFINMHGVVGEVTVAMNYAIQASLIILFIALGVAIPTCFSAG